MEINELKQPDALIASPPLENKEIKLNTAENEESKENKIIPESLIDAGNLDDAPTKIRKSRTKKDEGTREFVCGCGKQYLSYPALYTHVKQKHDSTFPEGTIMPPMNNEKKAKITKKPENSAIPSGIPLNPIIETNQQTMEPVFLSKETEKRSFKEISFYPILEMLGQK